MASLCCAKHAKHNSIIYQDRSSMLCGLEWSWEEYLSRRHGRARLKCCMWNPGGDCSQYGAGAHLGRGGGGEGEGGRGGGGGRVGTQPTPPAPRQKSVTHLTKSYL